MLGLKVGCTICWDLRFADLFAKYGRQGCSLVVCPAVFFAGVPTDIHFWESLLCARAIDNSCYLASATICGTMSEPTSLKVAPLHFEGVTRLIDPFGNIIARRGDDQPGVAHGTIERARIDEACRWTGQP